jgi:hypothetical protein
VTVAVVAAAAAVTQALMSQVLWCGSSSSSSGSSCQASNGSVSWQTIAAVMAGLRRSVCTQYTSCVTTVNSKGHTSACLRLVQPQIWLLNAPAASTSLPRCLAANAADSCTHCCVTCCLLICALQGDIALEFTWVDASGTVHKSSRDSPEGRALAGECERSVR